jgi:PucR C-terminal helix-turn-helix domain
MMAVQKHWTELLRSNPDHAATSLVSARELREAILEVGEEPKCWALQISEEISHKVGAQLAEVGESGAASAALQSGVQSAILSMLVAIRLGAVQDNEPSEESRESARVCVELGIDLATLLASVRRSHALAVERFMQACRALAPSDELPQHFASISEICFEFVDRLANDLTRMYAEEHRQWLDNPRAERLALVARLLAGEDVEPAKAAAVLRYEVAFRHHIAVCAWRCDDNAKSNDELEATTLGFLRTNQTTQTLIMQQPDGSVLGWGNSRTPLPDSLRVDMSLPGGVRLAVGGAGRGLQGFRASADQAREGQAIARRLPGLKGSVVLFRHVSLIGLLSSDVAQAQRFVQAELGSLAEPDEHHERLLETLEAFLDSHSPQAVAQQLFVARNTVTYRLRKIEELLGRSINERQPQLRAAILLARALRDSSVG